MDLKISGFSTALYSTYWFVEPLNILFDCGDGAATALQQKGRKVKTVACSHADRDHLTGLFQFLQINSDKNSPRVLFPEHCGSFPAMEQFINQFDPHVAEHAIWEGISEGAPIPVKNGIYLEAFANRHIPRAEPGKELKSLSYAVIRETKKLKPEFSALSGPEIGKVRSELGDETVLEVSRTNLLTYSGDTPIESREFWRDPEVLIHESTFLDRETAVSRGQDARHSVLPDVIEMAAEMPTLKTLILGHFSTRYHEAEIRESIEREASRCDLQVPVFAVFPGQFKRDLLGKPPVWEP